jgi:hypothetical protein
MIEFNFFKYDTNIIRYVRLFVHVVNADVFRENMMMDKPPIKIL